MSLHSLLFLLFSCCATTLVLCQFNNNNAAAGADHHEHDHGDHGHGDHGDGHGHGHGHGHHEEEDKSGGYRTIVTYLGTDFIMPDGCPLPACDEKLRDCRKQRQEIKKRYEECLA